MISVVDLAITVVVVGLGYAVFARVREALRRRAENRMIAECSRRYREKTEREAREQS